MVKIFSQNDCNDALKFILDRSTNIERHILELQGRPLNEVMQTLRAKIDSERPFFIGNMANGIRFAGDSRDFPSILHYLFPRCNSHLIGAIISEVGDCQGDFIDVGTNIGVVAASIARHIGVQNTVYAFEPSPETALMAAVTFALNELENVVLTEAAVGSATKKISFQTTPGNSAIAAVERHAYQYLGEWKPVEVDCISLDAFINANNITNVALIKIDVEGHEAEVLRGAKHSIAKLHPIVVFEFTPGAEVSIKNQHIESPEQILESLGQHKYKALLEPDFGKEDCPSHWVSFPSSPSIKGQMNVFSTPVRR